ncbi:MAG: hypothetical protein C0394_02025 [Syntrophus sp. (in: bacteria)]|nr:hypothetical protein [Syntrophus sp. (in: bacteria)]
MKQHESIFGMVFFAFLFFFAYPVPGGAAPHEVTLFPASAQVVEMVRLKIVRDGNLKKAVFTLPAQTDPESLVTRVDQGGKLRIMDQTWRRIDRLDDDRIKDLRQKIETLKGERNNMLAAIRAIETQIQFWQMQTKAKVKTTAEAGHFSTVIGKNVKKAYEDKLARDPELEKLNRRIKELEEEMNQTAGRKDTIWEVTLLLTGSPTASDIPVTYTYNLSGCGWSPLYRLEANPRDNQVLFTWEAEIWQSSGRDWSQVAMNLATLPPVTSIAPQDLPPWVIRPRPVATYRRASKKNTQAETLTALQESADEAIGAPDAAAAPVPREARQSTYSLWELGKVTLPAGVRQRVKVQDEPWPADFVHLIRPGLSGKAFVRASLNFSEAREIPSGMAIFMIDGAILGKRRFAFAGKEDSISFGEDPFVSAKVEMLTKQSGEKTFLADKQTYKWEWRTDIENRRNTAVRLRIEEPSPQSRDERIKLTLKNEPSVSEEKNAVWVWNMDLPAGQTKSIRTTVSLEAPKEMDIDLGWRK